VSLFSFLIVMFRGVESVQVFSSDPLRRSVLDLSNNRLSGGVPKPLEELVQLTKLHLSNNELSGALDSFVFHYPVLRYRSD
jgi:hypothetical protein